MKTFGQRLLTKGIRGDTIVEVMIAIVVAGSALAIAYQLSNASLRTSTQSSQRSQALSFSTGQIERMKYDYNQNPDGFVSTFENTTSGQNNFCVDKTPDDTGWLSKLYVNQNACGSAGTDNGFEGSIFSVNDTYDQSTDTFIITVTWPNINGHGNGTDTQSLYYRIPR